MDYPHNENNRNPEIESTITKTKLPPNTWNQGNQNFSRDDSKYSLSLISAIVPLKVPEIYTTQTSPDIPKVFKIKEKNISVESITRFKNWSEKYETTNRSRGKAETNEAVNPMKPIKGFKSSNKSSKYTTKETYEDSQDYDKMCVIHLTHPKDSK